MDDATESKGLERQNSEAGYHDPISLGVTTYETHDFTNVNIAINIGQSRISLHSLGRHRRALCTSHIQFP
jgi:hypothetical protein